MWPLLSSAVSPLVKWFTSTTVSTWITYKKISDCQAKNSFQFPRISRLLSRKIQQNTFSVLVPDYDIGSFLRSHYWPYLLSEYRFLQRQRWLMELQLFRSHLQLLLLQKHYPFPLMMTANLVVFYSPRWSSKSCLLLSWTYHPPRRRSRSYSWHWQLGVNGWRRQNNDTIRVEKKL